MYEAHFSLREKPFSLLPDPEFLYSSEQHRAAIGALECGLNNQAVITLLTGEVGCGKTTIIRHLLNNLGPEFTVGLISNTHRSLGENLLQWVLLAFGLPLRGETHVECYDALVDYLIEQYARNQRAVLVVDEAQNLDVQTVELLRVLATINADKDQLLQLMLVGQPELRANLRCPDAIQFVQRISVDCHIGPLTEVEIEEYVHHRLDIAGGAETVFEPECYALIYHYSRGVPRLINLLCDAAMVYTFGRGERLVSAAAVGAIGNDPHTVALGGRGRSTIAFSGERNRSVPARLPTLLVATDDAVDGLIGAPVEQNRGVVDTPSINAGWAIAADAHLSTPRDISWARSSSARTRRIAGRRILAIAAPLAMVIFAAGAALQTFTKPVTPFHPAEFPSQGVVRLEVDGQLADTRGFSATGDTELAEMPESIDASAAGLAPNRATTPHPIAIPSIAIEAGATIPFDEASAPGRVTHKPAVEQAANVPKVPASVVAMSKPAPVALDIHVPVGVERTGETASRFQDAVTPSWSAVGRAGMADSRSPGSASTDVVLRIGEDVTAPRLTSHAGDFDEHHRQAVQVGVQPALPDAKPIPVTVVGSPHPPIVDLGSDPRPRPMLSSYTVPIGELQQLQAQGERLLAKRHLTRPPGNNAFDVFHKILRMVPDYRPAIEGIENIRAQYEVLAAEATSTGDLDKAMRYYQRALRISPKNPGLLAKFEALTSQNRATAARVDEPTLQRAVGRNSDRGELFNEIERADAQAVTTKLDQGIPVDASGPYGFTPLISAAIKGHTDVAAMLLRRHADVNSRSEDGRTALMAAAWNGHIEMVRLLLDHGAAVNQISNEGWTPLTYAAWNGYTDIVHVLLQHGADPSIVDHKGWTALTIAERQGHSEVINLIRASN